MNSLSAADFAGPTVGTIVILVAAVITVAWVLVPFAVIGVKPLLRELIAEAKRTNALLEAASRARSNASHPAPELQSIRPER